MALVAHAEKDEIEAGTLARREAKLSAQFLLVLQRGLLCVLTLSADSVDLRGAERHLREHRFGSHAEVAVLVIGRNVALVTEKEADLVPGELRAQGGCGEQSI